MAVMAVMAVMVVMEAAEEVEAARLSAWRWLAGPPESIATAHPMCRVAPAQSTMNSCDDPRAP